MLTPRHISVLLPSLMLVFLTTLACSSADPGSQPVGEGLESSTATFVEPERYVLQQPLDFTMSLTTTSIGGTFGRLDRKHTCEKEDNSPHLKWEGVPDGTKSLALVMDDPASDVHGWERDVLWTHWVLYSIPPEVTELAVSQVSGDLLENGSKQGSNDYARIQYNGPCPIPYVKFPVSLRSNPSGAGFEHKRRRENVLAEDRPYYFRLYALDIQIDLPSGENRDTLMKTIDGHVLAAGKLHVFYKSVRRQACSSQDSQICYDSIKR